MILPSRRFAAPRLSLLRRLACRCKKRRSLLNRLKLFRREVALAGRSSDAPANDSVDVGIGEPSLGHLEVANQPVQECAR